MNCALAAPIKTTSFSDPKGHLGERQRVGICLDSRYTPSLIYMCDCERRLLLSHVFKSQTPHLLKQKRKRKKGRQALSFKSYILQSLRETGAPCHHIMISWEGKPNLQWAWICEPNFKIFGSFGFEMNWISHFSKWARNGLDGPNFRWINGLVCLLILPLQCDTGTFFLWKKNWSDLVCMRLLNCVCAIAGLNLNAQKSVFDIWR